ncbi:hypothetical protein Patl1_12707 [Pistacia atlantica]|uniref:Uncharacterized protein n=1 Tax=Pistacia atlantica TaxID=434234 RepID=A0ACC1ATT7_9ROSI|nr:hypothetical protein Patl1_12707 [Pistacia atlantica]
MNSLYSRIEKAKVLLISGLLQALMRLLFTLLIAYISNRRSPNHSSKVYQLISLRWWIHHRTLLSEPGQKALRQPPRIMYLSSQYGIDGLKDCDQMILDYLQQPSSSERERGVHIAELSQHLKIPEKKIMDSIVSLENEGLIYSTIDEFHYKFARG